MGSTGKTRKGIKLERCASCGKALRGGRYGSGSKAYCSRACMIKG